MHEQPVTMEGRIAELHELRRRACSGPSQKATDAQHAKGKLTPYERIEQLLDPGTFHEIGPMRRHRATGFGLEKNRPLTDGVITGWGEIHGQTVYLYAHDFRVFGGSLGEAHAEKIHRVMDLALKAGCPLISLNDGAGARIQEGVTALAGYGGIFRRHVQASGHIPQISVLLGPCAGGAAYSPALTDFTFMVRGTSHMFITGPDVVEAVTGETITFDELGGADLHGAISGSATFVCNDEETCFTDIRYLLSFLPANSSTQPTHWAYEDDDKRLVPELSALVPAEGASVYDMHDIITVITDGGDYLELHEMWAPNIICALARLGGTVVGIVANQPTVLAGVIDINASQKAARFVQMCNAFRIPLITLIDVPGFMPGRDQERGGIIRHGARLLYSYCAATVPRISLILRKGYGGAYIVLDSRSVGSDLAYAWPTNEIAVMGPEGAANVIFRREIAKSADPEETRISLIKEYKNQLMHPYYAAERGLVDDVIDPSETREVLIAGLRSLSNKTNGEPHQTPNPPL